MDQQYLASSNGANIGGTGTLRRRLSQHGPSDEPTVGFLVALEDCLSVGANTG
jgi:hypothetical protein